MPAELLTAIREKRHTPSETHSAMTVELENHTGTVLRVEGEDKAGLRDALKELGGEGRGERAVQRVAVQLAGAGAVQPLRELPAVAGAPAVGDSGAAGAGAGEYDDRDGWRAGGVSAAWGPQP